MSKFNTVKTQGVRGSGPIKTTSTLTKTYEGADAFVLDDKSALFTLAVTNMVSEDTFYEAAAVRDGRFRDLVRKVTKADPEWMQGFIPWLRDEANMRSASVVAVAEYVKAGGPNGRQVVANTLKRADEPGELLAYWTSQYGRRVPQPIKRGIADAIAGGLYNEYSVLKYDSQNSGFRFGDVINLTHPKPGDAKTDALFSYALDRRYQGNDAVPGEDLTQLNNAVALDAEIRSVGLDKFLASGDADARLKAAGWTWERLSSYGKMDAKAWEAIIPTMGYFALLRNLRNFEEAGISTDARKFVRGVLSNPEAVEKSRLFPYRFYQAYMNSNKTFWGSALEDALTYSVRNIPVLDGRTLVLVDESGSMGGFGYGGWGRSSSRSTITPAQKAGLFGAAIALRNPDSVDLVSFSTTSRVVSFKRGDAVLQVAERTYGAGGATNTDDAINRHWKGHDRVIILTDMQAWPGRMTAKPKFLYNFDLQGYGKSNFDTSAGKFLLAGFTDAAFKLIPMVESGAQANWPWE